MRGQREQHDEQHDRPAQRGLRRRSLTLPDQWAEPRTATRDRNATYSLRLVRKIEIATIGNNSPTAPAASTYLPKSPDSMSASCRIGSSVPSAVVVSASPMGTKSWTKPVTFSTATKATESAALAVQPAMPSGPIAAAA